MAGNSGVSIEWAMQRPAEQSYAEAPLAPAEDDTLSSLLSSALVAVFRSGLVPGRSTRSRHRSRPAHSGRGLRLPPSRTTPILPPRAVAPHIEAQPIADGPMRDGCGWVNGVRMSTARRRARRLRQAHVRGRGRAGALARAGPAAPGAGHLGQRVVAVQSFGTFSCRNIIGNPLWKAWRSAACPRQRHRHPRLHARQRRQITVGAMAPATARGPLPAGAHCGAAATSRVAWDPTSTAATTTTSISTAGPLLHSKSTTSKRSTPWLQPGLSLSRSEALGSDPITRTSVRSPGRSRCGLRFLLNNLPNAQLREAPCPRPPRSEHVRRLHESGSFVIPNPWDVGGARYLPGIGFPALATTSAGFAWSRARRQRADARRRARAIAELSPPRRPVQRRLRGRLADRPRLAASCACAWNRRRGPVDRGLHRQSRKPLYDSTWRSSVRGGARGDRQGRGGVLLTGRSEGFIRGRPDHQGDHPPAQGLRCGGRRLPLRAGTSADRSPPSSRRSRRSP